MKQSVAEQIPKIGDHCLWGWIDQADKIDRGIYRIGTPGHGGIWISEERRAEMPDNVLKPTDFYKDGPWFEEDVEALRAVYAFPDQFPDIDQGYVVPALNKHLGTKLKA